MKRTLNTTINRSKNEKNDEFYTQYADIRKKMFITEIFTPRAAGDLL